jgi:hypothetical protein
MIGQEDFERVINDVKASVFVSPRDVEALIVSLMEMDQHLVIAQSALDFTLTTAENLMKEVAQACVAVIGIRDAGKKRKLAQVAGEAAGRLAGALQLHIAGQILAAQEAASTPLDVESDEEEEES